MTTGVTARLKERITRHEGVRLKPYRCPAGRLTIGVGRNLEANGISKEEADFLLENDLCQAEKACSQAFSWYEKLDPVRQGVVLEMIFNLGFQGFLGFSKMIKALTVRDYAGAADEMSRSRWATQVGRRARELVRIMQTGKEVYE